MAVSAEPYDEHDCVHCRQPKRAHPRRYSFGRDIMDPRGSGPACSAYEAVPDECAEGGGHKWGMAVRPGIGQTLEAAGLMCAKCGVTDPQSPTDWSR